MEITRDFGVPLLSRGGGTSLAGQTVGEALDWLRKWYEEIAGGPTTAPGSHGTSRPLASNLASAAFDHRRIAADSTFTGMPGTTSFMPSIMSDLTRSASTVRSAASATSTARGATRFITTGP